MQQSFVDEIFAQADALSELLDHYHHQNLSGLLTEGESHEIILTGMGASFHAAAITAYQFQRRQQVAQAVEATEILNYPRVTGVRENSTLVYVSQSGSSGEVVPVFDSLPANVKTFGITNDIDSPLGQRADVALPLHAGKELTVATKTYLNSLAVLNLLAGVDLDALRDVTDRIQQTLDSAEHVRVSWLETLAQTKTLYFLGHGPHAFTARHSAMMMGEWAKRPAMYASIGAFRHGFLEAVTAETGVVIFAPTGVSQQSAFELGDELTGYGATVLLVENGQARRPGDVATVPPLGDELLSPMVDIVPVQLFVEALAREIGMGTGFRYISKVVKHI